MDEQTLYMQLEEEVEKYFTINSHAGGWFCEDLLVLICEKNSLRCLGILVQSYFYFPRSQALIFLLVLSYFWKIKKDFW